MTLEERLRALVKSDRVEALVATYFERPTFAGSLFETLGRNDPSDLTYEDLLAVSMLDVRFSPIAIRELWERRPKIQSLLQRISTEKNLWDLDDHDDDLVAGNELWNLIKEVPGVGWVKSHKILARKRPSIFPVYDSVTKMVLNPDSEEFWKALKTALVPELINRVRSWGASIDSEPSVLRLIDVAAWMVGSESENAREARQTIGYERPPALIGIH